MTTIDRPYRERVLSRSRMINYLRELESNSNSNGGAVLKTIYVAPGSGEVPGWEWLPPAAGRSPNGLVLVGGPEALVAISPPFALEIDDADRIQEGPYFGPLIASLTERHMIGFILLRLGAYAVGVADDEKLIVSKTGTRYVKGRHRKGGQSQRRFERNREGWIAKLYDQVCAVATTRLGSYERDMHALAIGGDRHVVEGFMKRCGFADRLRNRVATIDVPVERPGLKSLERAVTRAWGCHTWEAHTPRGTANPA